jgi:protein-S-isoprenylcysteine O-methyltransferase Ste14
MRWSNVPVPEPHVAALIGAGALHLALPLHLPLGRRTGRFVAGPLLAGGIGLAAWAVASAGEADVERDAALVTGGAYALSRNPMYVGWTAGVLGLACWTRSLWLVPAWFLAIHALDRQIDSEESRLLDRFGPDYQAYRDRVPRYIGERPSPVRSR